MFPQNIITLFAVVTSHVTDVIKPGKIDLIYNETSVCTDIFSVIRNDPVAKALTRFLHMQYIHLDWTTCNFIKFIDITIYLIN